jgi:hypothetical protein
MKVDAEMDVPGSWSVPEKRAKTNVRNLARFLSEKDKHGRSREKALQLGAHNFVELAKLYLAHQEELEHVFSYARRFKKAAAEITDEDVLEAERLLHVKDVMES